MKLKEFVKSNWIGAVIGVLSSGLVAFVSYKYSLSVPEPVFLIDTSRTNIIDSKLFKEAPLRLTRPDGSEIIGDITSVRFYFWNNGKKPIRQQDILEDITISLGDMSGEILDYKILKTSRGFLNIALTRSTSSPRLKLMLSFKILEKNDGFT
jgi:hypothetical protein